MGQKKIKQDRRQREKRRMREQMDLQLAEFAKPPRIIYVSSKELGREKPVHVSPEGSSQVKGEDIGALRTLADVQLHFEEGVQNGSTHSISEVAAESEVTVGVVDPEYRTISPEGALRVFREDLRRRVDNPNASLDPALKGLDEYIAHDPRISFGEVVRGIYWGLNLDRPSKERER